MAHRFPIHSIRNTFRSRGLHTNRKSTPFNIVFDIDGVLIKGKQVIPQTRRALELLEENNVPYIFLTNGGGVLESEKADQLAKKLGFPVNPDHMIVSHSPMRSLVPKYKDANVLVVGGSGTNCKEVAEFYGFRHVFTPRELHAIHPSICPLSTCNVSPKAVPEQVLFNIEKPVDAVMVFHDSDDWGRDLQVCLDALPLYSLAALVNRYLLGGALGTIKDTEELRTTKQSVPIFFSNPDVHLTGQDLEYTSFGKPLKSTYQYAESLLDLIDPLDIKNNSLPVKRSVYAVGDNPYSDIAGANAYGWNSVLVKTGVFRTKGHENHHVHPATAVVDNVEDAIRWIIDTEQMKRR
ncbi:hypothetical protein BGZ51_004855 [Haplosporangium sp. Z 767]|nr:hypothetical protein BGZ51_004855 [Haplosporangium sp. Z 767]